jgi:hypothetical protein
MGANNAKVQTIIESTFSTALEKLAKERITGLVNDLHVQLDREGGELSIYDDTESLVEKIIIFDWVNNQQPEDVFTKHAVSSIKSALTSLASREAFDQPCISKPFSINLTDEDFTVIEELLFIDDELLRLDDPLLKDLDTDLDIFLEKLLSDVE